MTGLGAPGGVPVATLVTAAAADSLPWRALEPYAGVEHKLLWRSGKSVAGLMRIPPGREVTRHAHVRSHHHMWVVDGTAELLGELVGPGSYVHIPARVDHGIRTAGDAACTMLYLYLREESAAAG